MKSEFIPMLIAATLVAACAASEPEKKEDGIADFIAVAELTPVTKVRTEGQYSFLYIDEQYVLLKTNRGYFLGQTRKRCPGLANRNEMSEQGNIALRPSVDIRTNPKIFWAGQDSVRGCIIDKLYALDDERVAELKAM